MKSLDKEELLKNIKEYEKEENSLKKQLGLSLVNLAICGLGITFSPATLVGVAGNIDFLIHGSHII